MRKLVFVLLITLFALIGTVSAQENTSYTVQRGDNLTAIANQFDVEVEALLIANNIVDPNSIRAGQVLVIPTGAVSVPRSHVVQAGENLVDISLRYNTTVDALVTTNNLSTPSNLPVGLVLTLPTTGGPATYARTYLVDIGDTLRNIGERFGVTWQQLAAFNNIPNPNYVQAGTVLNIPPVGYVVPTTPVVHPTPPVVQPTVHYVVQYGDTLSEIAVHFHVSLHDLLAANNLYRGAVIFPGQVLVIPSATHPTHPVVVHPRTAVNGYYTVRPGDTMFAIAASFGVNVYDLAEENGILNLNSIYSGQVLWLPY